MQDTIDKDITGEETIYLLADGFYGDELDTRLIYLHIGELLASRKITDTNEARLSVYAVAKGLADGLDKELIIIREEGVPSIADLSDPN